QMFVDWGLVTPTANVQDWTVYKPAWPSHDSVGVIPHLYTGFKAIHDEMLKLNAWLRDIGTEMLDLQWRDGYSIHWQDKRPGNDKDAGRFPRPLPSDEIITSVTSYHPVTGAVDSSWQTYVELGLFDTHFGHTEVEVNDPLLDTNYALV